MTQHSPEERDFELYVASYEQAAAFMVHLAKAHAFADGNKRTSLKLAKKEILPD